MAGNGQPIPDHSFQQKAQRKSRLSIDNSIAGGKRNSSNWLHGSIYYLATTFIFTAAMLRAILVYGNSPDILPILFLLSAFLLTFTGQSLLAKQARWGSYLLLGLEMVLILALLLITRSDFFAVLFAVLGMQAMRYFAPKATMLLIALSSLLTFLAIMESYGSLQALALALVYAGLSAFLGAYVWAARRAEAVNSDLQALVGELQSANHRLEIYSQQQAQLAAGRERQRWARELHDSVTQTIFSMSLTAQSAVLLIEQDKAQVGAQLDRMDQLTQNTLLEMQMLISELAPGSQTRNGFLAALRQHLADRHRLENLDVTLEVEGRDVLGPMEERGLLRIAREALNNIVKHAQVSQADLRLHLAEPFWMEIEDKGRGFDMGMARPDTQLGLTSMGERAAEMGWQLQVSSRPGMGTCVRAEKKAEGSQYP